MMRKCLISSILSVALVLSFLPVYTMASAFTAGTRWTVAIDLPEKQSDTFTLPADDGDYQHSRWYKFYAPSNNQTIQWSLASTSGQSFNSDISVVVCDERAVKIGGCYSYWVIKNSATKDQKLKESGTYYIHIYGDDFTTEFSFLYSFIEAQEGGGVPESQDDSKPESNNDEEAVADTRTLAIHDDTSSWEHDVIEKSSDGDVVEDLIANEYDPIEVQDVNASIIAEVFRAATTAQEMGASTAIAEFNNPGTFPLALLQAMKWEAGMPLRLKANSVYDGKTDVCITIEPALSVKDLNLSASTVNTRAKNTAAFFKKHFSNNIMAVSINQQGSFGQNAEIMARIGSGIDTTRLVFYSYDKKANSYKKIEDVKYWADKNGFIHFITKNAGDIVISDGTLAKAR